MKELIIDRFEEGYVVCETPTGGFDAIPRKNLPPNAEEGSCIIVYDDGHIEVDIEKTLRRRAATLSHTCKKIPAAEQSVAGIFSIYVVLVLSRG